jgi:uncharacterized protein YceH (UPF0502 family)
VQENDPYDATVLGELLEKNVANLAPENLKAAVSEIATACSIFK